MGGEKNVVWSNTWPVHKTSYLLAIFRHSCVTMMQPMNYLWAIYHVGEMLPITQREIWNVSPTVGQVRVDSTRLACELVYILLEVLKEMSDYPGKRVVTVVSLDRFVALRHSAKSVCREYLTFSCFVCRSFRPTYDFHIFIYIVMLIVVQLR